MAKISIPLRVLLLVSCLLTGCSNADSEQAAPGPPPDPAPDAVRESPLAISYDDQPIQREQILSSFAPVLREAKPAVVAVYTARVVRVIRQSQPRSFEEYMFRRFFGMPAPFHGTPDEDQIEERRVPQGIGSGVLISPDGYILTNNHVVSDERGEDADEVLVQLNDGTELPATIVGRDARTDIAVLKIEGGPFPTLTITNSDQLEVGDIVFAIGNPLGVGNTVTQGIVSATGRAIGIYGEEGYEDFIQTDASINMGNSGGALVDIRGRLVGINSAILSRHGGNIGIGFAIPSKLALGIASQLVEYGEVRRGYLGVVTEDLTQDLAEAFGLRNRQGALVTKVEPGSPAENAGLRHGDVIVTVDGKPVQNTYELRLRIGQLLPGTLLKMGIIREGTPLQKEAELIESKPVEPVEVLAGIYVTPLTDSLREQLNIPARVGGVIVARVDSDSPFRRNMALGMVIMEANQSPVDTPEALAGQIRQGAVNVFRVFHRGQTGTLQLAIR